MTLAELTPEQIERNITIPAEHQTGAAGVELTPEVQAMTSHEFAQHCMRMSQESVKSELLAKRD